jgi:hypothetical protein
MKNTLLVFIWLLLCSSNLHAQTAMPLYTGVYYRLKSNVIAFRGFGDTAIVAPDKPLFPPLALRAKEQVLVMAYPTTRWAQVVKGGVYCYVPTRLLVASEKPMADSSPAKIGAAAGASNYNPASLSNTTAPTPSTGNAGGYQSIRTGPRGGQFYINSKGNKTYIKRK